MGLRRMFHYRRSRRITYVIQRHIKLFALLLFIVALSGFFRRELIYQLYLLTLDIQPYRDSLTLWSSDFHISPIQDLKNLLIPLGVKFFDKSLSYSCSLTDTCSLTLRVLTQENGMNPSSTVRSQFYNFYKNQIEMNTVDAFVCFHPVGMCEAYIPFNRSMIIISSTRYELGRFEPDQWTTLNENLIQISQDPKNFIGANNLYDAEYIRYFTGLQVPIVPSFCNYTGASYNPSRTEFLLAPTHEKKFARTFQKLLNKSLQTYNKHDIKISYVRHVYQRYKFSDLTRHPAIVHIPYQVSFMSFFEQYRMNIPLVVPSLNLLTEWHYEYGVVNERTWYQALNHSRPKGSPIPGVLANVPDPNKDFDRNSIRYWLNFSDFYQWPHITYFDSTDDLIEKLATTDFKTISVKMHEYNQQVGLNVLRIWKKILNNVRKYSRKFQDSNQ